MDMQERRPFRLEDASFLALVILVTLAFALLVKPFFGAILWGLVAAIMFTPINRRLLAALGGRRNLASVLTLLLIVAMVIVPSIVLGMALIQEGVTFYSRMQTGEIDFARTFQNFQDGLPDWAAAFLGRLGLTNFAAAQEMVSDGLANSFRALAAQALLIGQSAFGFVVALGIMLYLTFFLLRDGDRLVAKLDRTVPLYSGQRRALVEQFVTVVHATIKGSVVVAIVQGLVGGIVFWFLGIPGALLWGVMMGFFSLLPAIGTGLIWVPVSIYLFAIGALWQGFVLVFCGVFIIGMVDNVLRPILVGRDTRMPDYVVLISTLGGIEMFGFNGLVIGPLIAALFISVWNILTETRTGQAMPVATEPPPAS